MCPICWWPPTQNQQNYSYYFDSLWIGRLVILGLVEIEDTADVKGPEYAVRNCKPSTKYGHRDECG